MDTPRSITSARLEMLFNQLISVRDQLVQADRKAQALFSANTLLVAAISFEARITPAASLGAGSLLELIGFIARVILLAAIAASSLSIVLALAPRVKLDVRHSLFYFGHAAAVAPDQLQNQFLTMTDDEAAAQIIDQIRANSIIAMRKYTWSGRAANMLVVALLMWITTQMLRFFV